MQEGQCGKQVGKKLWGVVCDENGIGGGGKNCRYNDAQLDLINAFYHEASREKYAPRAVFFDREPGVIGAVRASPLGELFRPRNLVNHTRGKMDQRPLQKG